jgi:hypothetical protein
MQVRKGGWQMKRKGNKIAAMSAFLIILTFALCARGNAASVISTLQDQQSVAVTVYNSNLGLVKDTRLIPIGKGIQEVQFMDVAGNIDPTTVQIKSLVEEGSLKVLEQSYEYDLLNPKKLLEKFVGRKIELARTYPNGKKEEIVEATLLSTQGENIYRIEDKISIGFPGRVLLPYVPEDLFPNPTLLWLLENHLEKPQRVEATYLTRGINWKADYVAVLNPSDTLIDLNGWVTIENRSGATYRNAQLKLVAGEPHRVEAETRPKGERLMMAAKEERPQFKEEAFFEYHIYSLDRGTTLKENQTKQMTLLRAIQVPVKKMFIFSGNPYFYLSRYDPKPKKQMVGVWMELENSLKNKMGMPLPKGTVRVYKEDRGGSLQFVGEDRIDHTPKDEKIKVKIGEAFDLVGERIQTEYKHLGRNLYEVGFEVSLRNHKKEDVGVLVEETIPGDWEMLYNTHSYEKIQANLIRFHVPVPMDQEVKVKYKIRFRY